MTVRFGVLGDVEARAGGRWLELGPARQRCVLAALLVDANQPVPVDALADRVWGQRLPQRSRETLYSYLSRLRGGLAGTEGATLTRHPGGYVLHVDTQSVDLHRFRHLAARARSVGEEAALALLREALQLWRGAAFGVLDTPWINDTREALDAERAAAESELTELRLRLGEHTAVIGELARQAQRHPLDERVAAQLMLALYLSGRTGEALEHYRVVRTHLAAELGIDPGTALQTRHQQILRADPALTAAPAGRRGASAAIGPRTEVAAPIRPVPQQLPAPPPLFVGRADELARIGAAWQAAADAGDVMPIVTISGTGGIGKTWLALRWAHEQRSWFPDGQLYVNLRGFDPSGKLVAPAEALRGFLDAFGVASSQMPAGLDDRAALYRSMLSTRRLLVVLDNARDEDQVRPLLPGSARCLVLVTSRSRLTALTVTDGASAVGLAALDASAGRDLLARRLGLARVAAEPAAVAQLLTRCAGLPLALAIVGARAAGNPSATLARLAEDLRVSAGGLDAFDGGDPTSDVRAVFSWSYRTLGPAAARLFRLVGLHPGPDLSAWAAASLGGLSPEHTNALLTELVRANLLAQPGPGRYGSHDLLRLYAAEQVRAVDSVTDRHAAMERLLTYYAHVAHAATLQLDPHQRQAAIDPPMAGVTLDLPSSYDEALAWCDAERAVLVAAVHRGEEQGHAALTWRLAVALNTYLHLRGRWDDLETTQQAALRCARLAGDLDGQALGLRALGLVAARVGRLDDAYSYSLDSLRLAEQLGDELGQARTELNLAAISERRERYLDAISHAQHALELYRAAGNLAGQARALNSVGWNYAQIDEYDEALAHSGKAVSMHQETGDRSGEASTWDSLGDIHQRRGNQEQALHCYQTALQMYRGMGDRHYTIVSLTNVGDSALACGDPETARRSWQEALDFLTADGDPNADGDRIRQRLDTLPT